MSLPVIQLEGVGKSYQIRHQTDAAFTYERLGDHLLKWIQRPFSSRNSPSSETFWALKDVSLKLHAGEVLGVVGSNGAGKSTLLKLISRITRPTTGRMTLDGRVASLLEVGTGFHPELTGRENIFLNGALLGMTRMEIRSRFDEIVAFAGVETFLDTPVKRYSSGMYVRLAFAVAAHLDPDILIVDEVLAVGDAAFRKRCLERMGEIASTSGRTILFVSHNMAAIRSLCTRAILLDHGTVTAEGPPDDVIARYHARALEGNTGHIFQHDAGDVRQGIALLEVRILQTGPETSPVIESGTPFLIRFTLALQSAQTGVRVGFKVEAPDGTVVFGRQAPDNGGEPTPSGTLEIDCRVEGIALNSGEYFVTVGIELPPHRGALFLFHRCLHFSVETVETPHSGFQRPPGIVLPSLTWSAFRPAAPPRRHAQPKM